MIPDHIKKEYPDDTAKLKQHITIDMPAIEFFRVFLPTMRKMGFDNNAHDINLFINMCITDKIIQICQSDTAMKENDFYLTPEEKMDIRDHLEKRLDKDGPYKGLNIDSTRKRLDNFMTDRE